MGEGGCEGEAVQYLGGEGRKGRRGIGGEGREGRPVSNILSAYVSHTKWQE